MRALAIAPYEGLKELIIELGRSQDFEIQVEVGDLEKGVELASRAADQGFDIIISRGGTAELIQKKISIPVIEIEVSGYDMLRVLTLVRDYPGKAAIVGFPPISEGAATVCQLLEIDISTYVISKEEEVKPTLKQLLEAGYEFIIGDVITVKEAENLGLNGVLVTSGKESILKAFQNAKKIHNYFSRLRRKLSIAQQILQEEEEGFVVFDTRFNIVYSNTFFTEQLNKTFKDSIIIEDVVTEIISKGKYTSIIENNNIFWKVKGTKLQGYEISLVLFRLQRVESNQSRLSEGVNIIASLMNSSPIKSSFIKSDQMKMVLQSAERYSKKKESIWISGEKGTGKEKLAHYIHFHSFKGSAPLMTVNCSLLTVEQWNLLLGEEDLLASNDNGTVFLKNIDSISLSNQKELMSYLMKNKPKSRIIVSSSENILTLIESGTFLYDLYYLLAELPLSLPPLSKRKEDIDHISRIFINESNTKYGKQIAGIRKEAIAELEDYNWPGNITQLKQVINETVLLAIGPFIEKEDIKYILNTKVKETEMAHMDLTGTLEEIEQRIIKQVWLEEGMNQTKTAERLGINRTTLWRKLKEI
ncbi:sigma-54-dependent Fis family transcriptional regulator [Litchfieldia salsa]|uniref:Transcriptional regulator containing PAS, AAA-type ATPase, and DNA-binding Fis domains n=1 Tax=Litchfieldia salsa TaxID=930152 RepID=A0A1H0WRP4_9BACI|nr:sigma-54-dependent transcriptional regulator [Litchfieldia salsa]SDP93323.1 Transcriptional regulator containing PAS, AAA-type ATPase, and DNA-binding Fis domains [Litchfieldia salsa]